MWFFFFLLLHNTRTCNNNKTLGTHTFLFHFFLKEALMWTQLRKKLVNLQRNQGSDPANPYTYPNSLQGPAVPLQKSKANLCELQQEQEQPHKAPQRTEFPRARLMHPCGHRCSLQPLHSGECHSLSFSVIACPQPGWDISAPDILLPAHLFECQKEKGKAQESKPHHDPIVTNRDNWRSRGGARGWGLL